MNQCTQSIKKKISKEVKSDNFFYRSIGKLENLIATINLQSNQRDGRVDKPST